jgi:hypothetical protein
MRRLVVMGFVFLTACDRLGIGGKADAGAAGSAAPGAASSGAVPDACALVSEQDLVATLGASPGAGKPMRVSPDRSTCMYPNGLIVAVEVAKNYEGTKKLIESQGRTTSPVAGVGDAAYWDSAGQLVVKGKKVFIGITQFGAQADKLKPLAAKLLAAADR